MTRKTTRKSSGTYRDKKGRTPVKIGPRGSFRVFTFNKSWSLDEVDRVRNQLKEVIEGSSAQAGDSGEPAPSRLVHQRQHGRR